MSVLGGDILKRFNIIVDWQSAHIYLAENGLMALPYANQWSEPAFTFAYPVFLFQFHRLVNDPLVRVNGATFEKAGDLIVPSDQ